MTSYEREELEIRLSTLQEKIREWEDEGVYSGDAYLQDMYMEETALIEELSKEDLDKDL